MSKETKVDFNSLSTEAIENLREDREKTIDLLNDLTKYAFSTDRNHAEVATALAKYVETLQRSTEQLVKLAGLAKKGTRPDEKLSSSDIGELYEKMQNIENE